MSEISRNGTAVTIKPGDIVASAVESLKTDLRGVLEGGLSQLTFDFSETTMIDSMGIGILIATQTDETLRVVHKRRHSRVHHSNIMRTAGCVLLFLLSLFLLLVLLR